MLKVIWGKRAFRIFVRQWRWEGDNVGLQAADTMRHNVATTIKPAIREKDADYFKKCDELRFIQKK